MKTGALNALCLCLLDQPPCLVHPALEHIVLAEVVVIDGGRIELKRLLAFGHRLVALSQQRIHGGQIGRGHVVVRVSLRPCEVGLLGFIEIAERELIVMRGDIEIFTLAYAISQIVGLFLVFRGRRKIEHVVVGGAEPGISHGEIRIKCNGLLEMGNGGEESFLAASASSPKL